MTDQPSRFLTLDEVAEELGLSRTQVFSERTTTLATTDPAATPYTGHPFPYTGRTELRSRRLVNRAAHRGVVTKIR